VRKGLRVTHRDCLADQKIISLPLAGVTDLSRWRPMTPSFSTRVKVYLHGDSFHLIILYDVRTILLIYWLCGDLQTGCISVGMRLVGAARELIIYLSSVHGAPQIACALYLSQSLSI
jgi:hypothetical protein